MEVSLELETQLRQAHELICRRGEACDYGCAPESITRMLSIAKDRFAGRPYCVVADWVWVDLLASQPEKDRLARIAIRPSFIFAANVLDDEARRPHISPMVRTSLLQHFEENCLFVTAKTVYVLCGHGKRTTVTPEVAASITF